MDRLDGALIPEICAISSEAGQPTNRSLGCPSSQWQSIQNWISLSDNSLPQLLSGKLNADVSPYAVQIIGKSSLRQFQIATFEGVNPLQQSTEPALKYIVSTTQQAAIADALVNTGALWEQAIVNTHSRKNSGASLRDQQDALHMIKTGYYQPYSMASCILDSVQGPDDQRPIAFPINPAIDYAWESSDLKLVNSSVSGIPAIEYKSLTRAALLGLPGRRSQNRVEWVELPEIPFHGTSIGAIILLSRIPSDEILGKQGQDIVVCNIGAGWGSSSISTNSFRSTISATSSVIVSDSTASSKDFKLLQSQLSPTESFGNFFEQVTNPSIFYRLPWYPTLQIKINKEWANYLNPVIPELNTNVIDALLKGAAFNHSRSIHPETTAQIILSGLMTNGLAMQGYNSQIQGSYKTILGPNNTRELDGDFWLSGKGDFFTVDPQESENWLELRVDSTVKGYVYNSQGVSVKIAMAILSLYCAFAIGHCIHSGIFGTLPN